MPDYSILLLAVLAGYSIAFIRIKILVAIPRAGGIDVKRIVALTEKVICLDIKDYVEKIIGKTVLGIAPTAKGSGSTFDVTTDNSRYIAKLGVRADYISIYQNTQMLLEKAGFRQSHIIYHDEYIILYEWLAGDSSSALTNKRMCSAISYTKRYFEALNSIPVDEVEITRINAWDDAKSLVFLLDEFPFYAEYLISPCIRGALEYLSAHRQVLEEQPRQLIHSDLGADNFLFIDDEVASIIDFTPEIAPDLYGLAQFLYWNILWQNNNPYLIHEWVSIYSSHFNFEIFDLFMVQAALFRVVGPLLSGNRNLDKRLKLLGSLLKK